MTGGPAWIAWFWWIGGWAVALAGVTLLLWAMFWDRSRGRRRCPKCQYDMSATPGLRCSECGYEAKRERRLFKTRRRWRCAMIALLLLVAAHIATSMPRVRRDGWFGVIPTTLLIAVYPWGIDVIGQSSDDAVYLRFSDHFEARIGDGMWRWQLAWMNHRTYPLLRAEDVLQPRRVQSAWQIFDTTQSVTRGLGDPFILDSLRNGSMEEQLHAANLAEITLAYDPAILVELERLAVASDERMQEAATHAIASFIHERDVAQQAPKSP